LSWHETLFEKEIDLFAFRDYFGDLMKNVLLSISREAFTGADTILGIFPDTVEGLELARLALACVQSPDEGLIYRAPFGVTLHGEGTEWNRLTAVE